eukprot:6654_1
MATLKNNTLEKVNTSFNTNQRSKTANSFNAGRFDWNLNTNRMNRHEQVERKHQPSTNGYPPQYISNNRQQQPSTNGYPPQYISNNRIPPMATHHKPFPFTKGYPPQQDIGSFSRANTAWNDWSDLRNTHHITSGSITDPSVAQSGGSRLTLAPLKDTLPSEDGGDQPITRSSYATLTSSSFKDFMLQKELMRAIGDAGFEHPSEVQHSAIPKAILGQDMIVQAKSGVGKTAVFVLATLAQVQPEKDVIDTLVLCHTREMASQIFGEFERFSKYMSDVQIGLVYGGIPYLESKRVIEQEKPHILIGTPGRIVHLLETGVLRLGRLKRFIIDECDNMLDQIDMRKQVQDIFKRTPHSKQVMMFSATIGEFWRPTDRRQFTFGYFICCMFCWFISSCRNGSIWMMHWVSKNGSYAP